MKREARIEIKVSAEERKAFLRLAEKQGLPLATWFRQLAKREVEKAKEGSNG